MKVQELVDFCYTMVRGKVNVQTLKPFQSSGRSRITFIGEITHNQPK